MEGLEKRRYEGNENLEQSGLGTSRRYAKER